MKDYTIERDFVEVYIWDMKILASSVCGNIGLMLKGTISM